MKRATQRKLAATFVRFVTAFIAVGMIVPSAPAVVRANTGAAEVAAAFRQQRLAFEAIKSELDATTYDMNALGLQIAFDDAEEIAQRIWAGVSYEVYKGLLRGAQGTLVAGAGNALDQAVLLANLLSDAGYETRIGLGHLDDDQGMRLVASMFSGNEQTVPQVDPAALERMATKAGLSPDVVLAAFEPMASASVESLPAYAEARAAHGVVTSSLAAAGISLGSDQTSQLLAEAQDYAWVEYRLGSADDWAAAHPAWPDLGNQPEVQATGYLHGSVPEELQHRMRIEVVVERKRGDDLVTTPVMTAWERPVANMLGVTLTVGNTVLGGGADTPITELGTSLSEVAFFVPTLNGAMAPGAQAFDTMGNVVPPDAAGSAMAGVFQTAADKMNTATGLLGALGTNNEPTEPMALTAQWVDYILIAPGGQETVHRRYIFDRLTPDSRVNGGVELQDKSVLFGGILTTHSVVVAAGHLSDTFVAAQMADQVIDYSTALETLSASTATGENLTSQVVQVLGTFRPRDQLALITAFDLAGASQGGVAYRAAPTVVALYNSLTPSEEPTAASGVDIIANARRFLSFDGSTVHADAQAAVMAGTWETVVERGYMERGGADVMGAYSAFASASGSVVIAPYDIGQLGNVEVSTAALPAIGADLRAGYAVVLPAGGAPDDTFTGWWRVDPATGETLGMGASGKGTSTVEYTVTWQVSAALAGVLAVPGAIMCATSGSGAAIALCLCDLAVVGAVAFGAGLGLGAALAGAMAINAATIISFLTFDIALGVVTAVPGLIPGPCSALAGGLDNSMPLIRASGPTQCVAAI